MRTTVTLDDDVAKRLQRLRSERRAGFKEVLNDVLRAGLAVSDAPITHHELRRTEPFDLGGELIDVANVGVALALAEGDQHR